MNFSGSVRLKDVLRPQGDAIVVLGMGGSEVARWPLAGSTQPDLAVVDTLARLALTARRHGAAISLRNAGCRRRRRRRRCTCCGSVDEKIARGGARMNIDCEQHHASLAVSDVAAAVEGPPLDVVVLGRLEIARRHPALGRLGQVGRDGPLDDALGRSEVTPGRMEEECAGAA